jgi:hypothetical protein
MNRDQFDHLIRAAAGVTGLDEFVVIGSQAILAVFEDAPRSLRRSIELDLYPAKAPERSEEIDGSIGELSLFHSTHGIYAHGVAPETACLLPDWLTRCHTTSVPGPRGKVMVRAPDPHDLAFSKLAAGRTKDIAYVTELLRCSLIRMGRLEQLIAAETNADLQQRLKNALQQVRASRH